MNEPRTRRGALIGCGFFAENHMHAWAEIEGARIVALCDRDVDRAKAMAKRFGIDAVYDDIEPMLAAAALDFVDIATTAPSHRSLVERAVGSVPTVICQKPFAESQADAQAMVAAAERASATLLVHENFRWQAPFVALAERIDAGVIGTPHYARFAFRHGFDIYAHQPYLAEVERLALMDVGLHLFDLARRFLGEVESIRCVTQRVCAQVRGEDAFTALLTHTDGAHSVCECSFATRLHPEPFPRTLAWLEGPAGTLVLDEEGTLAEHASGTVHRVPTDPAVPSWGAAPWHVVQDSVRRFQQHAVHVMQGDASAAPSGADNLRTLSVALAAYASAASGETIKMDGWQETPAS